MAAVAQKVENTLLLLRSAWSDVVVVGVADNEDGLVKAATGATDRAQRRVVGENFMVVELLQVQQDRYAKNFVKTQRLNCR